MGMSWMTGEWPNPFPLENRIDIASQFPYAHSMRSYRIIGIWLILFSILLMGHYALSPVTDFSADDWHYLSKSLDPTPSTIVQEGIRDIYRPVNLIANTLFFHVAGDRPLLFSLWGMVAHGILLGLLLALIRRLGGTVLMLWVGGLAYVLNPNIYESFHWACHEVLLYVPIVLAASLLLWIAWCQKPALWKYAAALPLYFIGVFSYEYAVPLVLLYPFTVWVLGSSRKRMLASLPFVALALLYLAWRFTHAFGWGVPLLAGSEYFGDGPSLFGSLQNIRGLLSWWLGGRMAQSFLGGWVIFSGWTPKWQFLYSVLALSMAWLAYTQMHRMIKREEGAPADTRWVRLMVLGLVWAALTYAPHLIFPVSARHNLFPSIGLAIAFAAFIQHSGVKICAVPVVAIVFLCLTANAGNTLAFRQAGVFSRNLYAHVLSTAPEWTTAEKVVFSTKSLRERQTKGILLPASRVPETWAFYQNANLIRGFTCSSMLKYASKKSTAQALIDVEYGVRVSGERLVWHERYDLSQPRETRMQNVYWIDCLSAGQIQ